MSAISSGNRRRIVLGILVILVLIVLSILGYSLIRYLSDKNNYEQGHQAYLQADCVLAIKYFDNVMNGSRLINLGRYVQLAEQERAECQVYQAAVNLETNGDISTALVSYLDFFLDKRSSPLAEAARNRILSLFQMEKIPTLASETTCIKTGTLLENNLIPDQDTNLPLFYFACGQAYDRAGQAEYAFALYQWILTSYPDNPAAVVAESSLLASPLSCREIETLGQSIIANRANFMQTLYYGCGQRYEGNADYDDASKMYETFLAYFPDHAMAEDVKDALARTIVAQARAAGAGEISQPEASGTTTSGVVQVVIQNDSPDRMRVTFSGPNSIIEELDPCLTCITYTIEDPLYCPEMGPVGRYTLTPGPYDIVVESISDNSVTPWVGAWNLADGNEYYRCFYLSTVTQ